MSARRPEWLLGLAVAGYVVIAAAAVVTLVVVAGPGDGRATIGWLATEQVLVLAIGTVLALAGLVALVARPVGARIAAARRLTADVRLLVDANPDHEVDATGPTEFTELAAAIEALAGRRRDAERAVDAQITAARADVEAERNRLAALMAELGAAVLVCNDEGRILLYNAAAKVLLGEDAAVGLGRSVFGIVDRELIVHAMDRIGAAGERSHVSTTLRGDRLLQVQVAPARGGENAAGGYVLLLEDVTDRVAASVRLDESLREVTEGTRASLASIQAAIENVLEYPDMDAADRQQFLGIVREESVTLGRRVQEWVDGSATHLGAEWPRTEMTVDDLLAVAARAVERDVGVPVTTAGGAGWVKVDGHALTRALVAVAARCRAAGFDLAAVRVGTHVRIELRWPGAGPAPGEFASWLAQPLPGGASVSAADVVARHGGEAWCEAGDGSARMCLMLPVTDPAPAKPQEPQVQIPSRPEFYDFGLFERHAGSGDTGGDLAELSYTVFDTETTGLDPTRGDRIVSVGAVRVVNGRVLHGETFERLVDPQRAVPAASTAVHGITTAMVRGQPTIDVVLPAFDRFTADTVLVGHNVGFDLQFLRLERERASLSAASPVVLDTLLLDAVVHPEHEAHSLEAIAGRLGVDVLGRHTALGDALVTGEVFVRLVALLRGIGVHTLDEAVTASRKTLHARLDESMYGS
ncbi:MAG TPA: exonuclease domain-containing protein [Aldersonia sp.]